MKTKKGSKKDFQHCSGVHCKKTEIVLSINYNILNENKKYEG